MLTEKQKLQVLVLLDQASEDGFGEVRFTFHAHKLKTPVKYEKCIEAVDSDIPLS